LFARWHDHAALVAQFTVMLQPVPLNGPSSRHGMMASITYLDGSSCSIGSTRAELRPTEPEQEILRCHREVCGRAWLADLPAVPGYAAYRSKVRHRLIPGVR
jgi:hypothetical protein